MQWWIPQPPTNLIGTLAIVYTMVPTRGSIPEVSFEEEWKRKLAFSGPRRPVSVGELREWEEGMLGLQRFALEEGKQEFGENL